MRSILIIDDDNALSDITKDMLEDYGYEVAQAFSVDEAFEVLTDRRYDLIILDINLPDGTGFEVCEELRSVSNVPVIFAMRSSSFSSPTFTVVPYLILAAFKLLVVVLPIVTLLVKNFPPLRIVLSAVS